MAVIPGVWLEIVDPGPVRGNAIVVLRYEGEVPDSAQACPGCPYGNDQLNLFNENLDGPGSRRVNVQGRILNICCQIERVIGHNTDLEDILIYERKRVYG